MINEDGSRKKSFNPSLPKNYRCLGGALYDGHIYAGGTIMNGNFSEGGFIVKLDKDGNKTIDFNVNVTSFDSSRTSVKFIMPMSKNRILISGSFDFCNGNRVYHNNAIFDNQGNFISELDFGRYSNELRSYVKVGKDFYVIGELITDFGAIGAVKITNIETSTMDEEKDPISIFPNPTTNGFKLNANADLIQIYNSYGQLQHQSKNYSENTNINVNFEKGIYIVKGLLGNGRYFSELLVKN